MKSSTVWTVIGVIGAIVIASVIVQVLFSVIQLVAKLLIIAVVAVIVFFVLRAVFSRSRD